MNVSFKDFLILTEKKQPIGLGNLQSQILKAFNAIPSVTQTDFKRPDYLVRLPNLDVELPTTTGNGTIQILNTKRNPIFMRLSDGTECYFTIDEFRRIKGSPALGKSMTITFQKSPDNLMKEPSKIISARVY